MSAGYSRPSAAGRLLNGPSTSYQALPYQVQNVKKNKVYVFGDADVTDDENVEFEMDVRSRKGQRQQENIKDEGPSYIERKITEDDSLSSLALQYGCHVSEIKRINNLIQDQEFYALTKLKIPVKNYSFLIESHKSEAETVLSNEPKHNGDMRTSSIDSYPESDADSSCNLSDPDTQKRLIRTLSINETVRNQSKEARDFLNNMDKDLAKLRDTTRIERNSLDEVINVLTNKSVQPLVRRKPEHLNGADCGIRWKTVVIIVIIAAVVLPCLYVIYLYATGKLS